MDLKNRHPRPSLSMNIDSVARFISQLQYQSGEIPWHIDGKTDPWDLVESAMGLNIGGFYDSSKRAFGWMATNQNSNGSWYSSYIKGIPEDRTMETNMTAYIATGLLHTWITTRDTSFLKTMWPCMERAIDFSISLQTNSGEIYWAKSPEGNIDPMALLTGCSSIYMSLKCALTIAQLLNKKRPLWETAFCKLGRSLKEDISLYNISKSRFSMYWFYPILSGALTGEAATRRIEKYWKKYIIEGQGVRCVSDRPWVTMAETSEFVLALSGMGNVKLARIVFSWIQERTYEDGTFWCGYTFPDMVIWPEEKISWTNGVVLMAADALYGLTPAARLFDHDAWEGFIFKDCAGEIMP